jgi:hypothetical protein
MTQKLRANMDKQTALALLQPFIGHWKTTGKVYASTSGSPESIDGTDVYEWLPGGFFVLHKVNVFMGNTQSQSSEIIGFDEERQVFTMHSFDDLGNETLMMAVRLQNNLWTFEGDNLRFNGGFSKDGMTLSGTWEQRNEAGKWSLFIRIHLAKQVN